MELIVALSRLAEPGGPQTYSLTVGEELARLGHGVTLYARELGAMAQLARERALRATDLPSELPESADGVLVSADRPLAVELAARYPGAARAFVVHGIDEIHLPPPLDGVVAASVALSDRFAQRVAATAGAGEVVRMRQPVNLRRFGALGAPAAPPLSVLLAGNYHGAAWSRAHVLERAWAGAGLRWERVGQPEPQLDVAPAMAAADIVVGYGRSIVEAMASGRPAYVFDHAGADGWVTPESYARIEGAGFSGMAGGDPPDAARLRADLDAYSVDLGRLGHDLARTHHDVRMHAAELVALLERIAPEPPPADRSALRALALLAEAQMRAEIARDVTRGEARQWFIRAQELDGQLRVAVADGADARARLEAIRATRRYRVAQRLGRVAEALRRARPRRPPR